MKKLLLFVIFLLQAVVQPFAFDAKSIHNVSIDTKNCTLTKDGRVFPLYGKVQIVDAFPDVTVKLVDAFADIDVQLVNSFPDDCGEVQLVDVFPDVRVQIVESFPGLEVKLVESFPGF